MCKNTTPARDGTNFFFSFGFFTISVINNELWMFANVLMRLVVHAEVCNHFAHFNFLCEYGEKKKQINCINIK